MRVGQCEGRGGGGGGRGGDSKRLRPRKENFPRFEGWWGHEKSSRFNMPKDFQPINTAEAWQISNPPILSMAALLSSLEIFHEATISQLRKKSEKLTSYLESLLKSELEKKIDIITPLSVQSRGCQLSIRLRESIDNITENLHERGVLSDWREPDVIRVAPVPLYNTFEDCFNFVRILKDILNEQC